MKILFAGTPEFTIPVLKMLANDFNLTAVLTNPPVRKGRSKALKPSDVAEAFLQMQKNGVIPTEAVLLEPHKLDSAFETELKKLDLDILVCFAYGKIFKESTLSLFKYGGINIHPSLLPRWRGATPVPSAIANGDNVTGVSIQTLTNKLDSGKILAVSQREVNNSTAGELLNELSKDSVTLLKNVLNNFDECFKNATPQNDSQACYCTVFQKEDSLIDWSKSAVELDRKIRSLLPKPGAYAIFENGQTDERINILECAVAENFENSKMIEKKSENQVTKTLKFGSILGTSPEFGILVQTGDGILSIKKLQRQGKKPLFWKDFLNGFPKLLDGVFS